MNNESMERWNERAWALPAFSTAFGVPLHVLLGEAVDVVRFAQRHWEPTVNPSGWETKPGLKTAVGASGFHEGTVTELLELIDAVQEAHTSYRLLVSGSKAAPMDRALFVLSELRATLEWCFDDGTDSDEHTQLGNLGLAHEKAASHDAVAAALFDYATLASRSADKIRGLGGFDLKLIDEARVLVARLREQSAGLSSPRPKERQALELRPQRGTICISTPHGPPSRGGQRVLAKEKS
jgi:hypothetical protein